MSSLIYHYGALGDFIAALPAFACCREQFAGPVTLLGKTAFGKLARQSGYVDTVLDADDSNNRFIFTTLSSETSLKSFFEQFDALFLFTAEDTAVVTNARHCFPGAIIRQNPLPARDTRHVSDQHRALFPATTTSLVSPFPELRPTIDASEALCKYASQLQRPFIVIHPGSGSPTKNWLFEHFRSVAETMKTFGFAIVWITGPAEAALPIPASDTHLKGLPLTAYPYLFSQCTVYLGNDSGMSHLAAAAGAPSLTLFGPSDPNVWAPRGIGICTILHHPPAGGCAPCHLQSKASVHCGRDCIKQITLPEVVQTLLALCFPSEDDENVSLR